MSDFPAIRTAQRMRPQTKPLARHKKDCEYRDKPGAFGSVDSGNPTEFLDHRGLRAGVTEPGTARYLRLLCNDPTCPAVALVRWDVLSNLVDRGPVEVSDEAAQKAYAAHTGVSKKGWEASHSTVRESWMAALRLAYEVDGLLSKEIAAPEPKAAGALTEAEPQSMTERPSPAADGGGEP